MNLEMIVSRLSEAYDSNPNLDLKDLLDVVAPYKADDYLKHVEYTEAHYNRITLFRRAEFEILLLCWNPGQASGFHQHAPNGCILKVLEGSLSEERKPINDASESYAHPAGSTIYMSNELGTHRVFNDTDSKTVSLHIYAPSGFA